MKKYQMISTKKNGFTLVELLISMGILSILIAILAQLFGSIIILRQKSESISAIAQDARYMLLRLSYDTSRATTVSASSNTLSLVIGGVSYVYAQDGDFLKLTVAGSTSALNSTGSKVSQLSFVQQSDIGTKPSVAVSFTLTPTSIQTGGVTTSRQVMTTLVGR